MEAAAAELADRLGLRFADLSLLAQALVHSSYTNEQTSPARSNDRLEFLGDAVVALVVSEDLFARHPDADEGELTTRRAAIVSARGLAAVANRLQLGEYVVLGHGASLAGERARNSILAGAFEAVTARSTRSRAWKVRGAGCSRCSRPSSKRSCRYRNSRRPRAGCRSWPTHRRDVPRTTACSVRRVRTTTACTRSRS